MHKSVGIVIVALVLSSAAYAQAVNPEVSQANIETTICHKGWTATIRPPRQYTTRMKIEQLMSAGIYGRASDYEEDHIIPLELGGHPTDPRNLRPQPWPEARQKDKDESRLNKSVCQYRMSLEDAQREMAGWSP